MTWSICGVLLVVVAVTVGFDSIEEDFQQRELTEASWYCYDLTTLAEEPIARSEVALFAAGANKEGKTIKVGALSMLTTDVDHSSCRYCAMADWFRNDPPLTPNNKNIKYLTLAKMTFYSSAIWYPEEIWEGFRQLREDLIQKFPNFIFESVHFGRPTVIAASGEMRGLVLYPKYPPYPEYPED